MRQIGHKCFIGLMVMCLSWSLVWAPVAQAQTQLAAGRMSAAIAEITVAKLARYGFAANDPRVTATKAGMSAGLTVLAAGAGVVGWPALLLAAGVVAVVGGAVVLAKDSGYTWSFGANGGITAGGSSPAQYAASGLLDGVKVTPATPITAGTMVYSIQVDYYNVSTGKVEKKTIMGTSPEMVALAYGGAMIGGSSLESCGSYRTPAGMPGYHCYFRTGTGNPRYFYSEIFMDGVDGQGVVGGVPAAAAAVGFYDGRPPAEPTPIAPILFAKPDDAVAAIPAVVASAAISSEMLAAAVNTAWKKAEAATSSGGVPWSASDPVTPADVSDWASANPGKVPTVSDFTASSTASVNGQTVVPVGSTYSLGGGLSGTMPSGSSGGGSSSPGTSPGTTPTTNPTPVADAPVTPSDPNAIQVNLGPIPNIGAPILEDAPDASKILGPGFSLMPDLKNFAVPAHAGVCPTAGFALYGKSYVVDAHCNLLEQNRSVIGALMVLIFTLVATYTVLRA